MKIKVEVVASIELCGADEINALRDICTIASSQIVLMDDKLVKEGSWDEDSIKRNKRNMTLIKNILEEIR